MRKNIIAILLMISFAFSHNALGAVADQKNPDADKALKAKLMKIQKKQTTTRAKIKKDTNKAKTTIKTAKKNRTIEKKKRAKVKKSAPKR